MAEAYWCIIQCITIFASLAGLIRYWLMPDTSCQGEGDGWKLTNSDMLIQATTKRPAQNIQIQTHFAEHDLQISPFVCTVKHGAFGVCVCYHKVRWLCYICPKGTSVCAVQVDAFSFGAKKVLSFEQNTFPQAWIMNRRSIAASIHLPHAYAGMGLGTLAKPFKCHPPRRGLDTSANRFDVD